jgi:hypothetical protein
MFTLEDDSMEPELSSSTPTSSPSTTTMSSCASVLALLFRQYRARGPKTYDLVPVNPDWSTYSVTRRAPAETLGRKKAVRAAKGRQITREARLRTAQNSAD